MLANIEMMTPNFSVRASQLAGFNLFNIPIMQKYYTAKYVGDPAALQGILSTGIFTHGFCTLLISVNATDESFLLIEKLREKPVEEKLDILEASFERQYAICQSAVKDHSYHVTSEYDQNMMLVENGEPEELEESNPSSTPNDELIKSMLASRIESGGQSIDIRTQNKPARFPQEDYEPTPNPTKINRKIQEIFSHLLHRRYDQLLEDACISTNGNKIPCLDPKRSNSLIKGNMGNNIKRALLMCQLSAKGCPACVYFIEKQPTKVPFPHLLPTNKEFVYLSTGIYHCPNLMSITNMQKKYDIINNIQDICRICLRVNKKPKCTCEYKIRKDFFCKKCDCHFFMGSCHPCKEKVKKHTNYYTNNFKASCQQPEKNINLSTCDNRMISAVTSISSVSSMKNIIGKCKESVASELNPGWPTDWKAEEIIFPGQKASMVINCYTDLEKLQKVKKRAHSESIFILLKLNGHNGEIIF